MYRDLSLELESLTGNEAMLYGSWMKLFGTREKTADILSPKYNPIGEVMLPRNSIIHYQRKLMGEVGPSNTAPFISNYDKRINIFFNTNYEAPLGIIKVLNIQLSAVIKKYEGSHFIYTRTRNYNSVISKEGELLVNNLAIGQVPVVYKRQTVFTPFQNQYNDLYTVIDAVESFKESTRSQFIEIKLPKTFPTFKRLQELFAKYKKFFNEDMEIVKYDKVTLAPFQAERSFWLLDLYGILTGFDNAKYSQFSRLSPEAQSKLEIIFTYNGKCWIVNLQNVINLLSYSDKETDIEASSTRINYFKRFYLSLIGLVTPITEMANDDEKIEEDTDKGEDKEEGASSRTTERDRRLPRNKQEGKVLVKTPAVDNSSSNASLADLYTGNKGSDPIQDDSVGSERTEDNSGTSSEEDGFDDSVEWGAEVDDELFEQASVEGAAISVAEVYTPTSAIERELKQAAIAGTLTNKEKEFFEKAANSYKNIELGGKTVEEIISYTVADLALDNVDVSPDSVVVRDKAALKSRTFEMQRQYNERLLQRNIVEMILYGTQNGKLALVDLDKESTTTVDSKYDVWMLRTHGLKGSQSTRRIPLPRVGEDGTMTMNGDKTYMQITRMEKPIRKIKPYKVALTSYYDKKIMIERSIKKADDYARWLKAAIIEKSYVDPTVTIKLGGYKSDKSEICYYYSVLASRFKSITNENYVFDFDTDSLIKEHPEFDKLCTGESWVIGIVDNSPILIGNDGLVTIDGLEIGYIEEILGLNTVKAPVPTVTININGYQFPSVVVLAYWIGFSELLKILSPEMRVIPIDQKPQITADEFYITLADERLVFNKRDGLSTLILSGMSKLINLQNFSRTDLDNPNIWFSLIGDDKVKPTHFKEMGLIYDMFIDPITKRELVKMGYPFIIDKLIIEGIRLLLNNEAKPEIEITEQRFVGYERIPGHIYRELVKANRSYRNLPNNGKKTLDLNPQAVMMNIITDSSVQSAEEVNPIHQLKMQEEVTFGGTMGRSQQAMVRRTRGQLPNYAGIISEAGKDSGKVGFISYLTADAKLVDLAGNVDVDMKGSSVGKGSTVLNLLYGGTKDDSKRSLFSSVQQSQVMACDNYTINPLRTSYDTIIAYRASELYSSFAKQDGVIKSIKPEGIVVEYADGSEGKFSLGYEVGKGAGEIHRHVKITDMVEGQKFTKGEVLAWDSGFFDRDPIDRKRVVWKSGGLARIALIEDQFTFEDSIGISKKFAQSSTTPYVKLNDFKLNADQSIKLHVKVGDNVEYDQILCDIQDPVTSSFDTPDDELFDGLDRLGIKQIHAKQPGKIVRIDVVYNGDIETWSESAKAFVKKFDGVRGKEAQYKQDESKTGNVLGNTNYGKSKVYPGTAVVYIYIDNKIDTTTADKFVVGNQMKGTVGFIYEYPIYTVDGREVDITFSLKSLLNRMVLSLRDKLVANEINNVYTSRMISKYGKY